MSGRKKSLSREFCRLSPQVVPGDGLNIQKMRGARLDEF